MSLEVEYFLISSTDASNSYVSMVGTPVAPGTNVAMDTISGTAQALNNDFGVDMTTAVQTRIRWNAPYNLYGQIAAGDRVRIIYDKA